MSRKLLIAVAGSILLVATVLVVAFALTRGPRKLVPKSSAHKSSESWQDGRKGILRNDLRVTVVKTEVRPITIDEKPSDVPYLVVTFELKNESETRKRDRISVEYFLLGSNKYLSIADDLGNSYSAIFEQTGTLSFDTPKIAEPFLDTGTLYPGESTTGVLIFERPVPAAKTMRLHFPAGALGEKEPFLMEFKL